MLSTYTHKFKLPSGSKVFVPSVDTHARGRKFMAKLLRRWPIPPYYYHLRPGGHLKALSVHLSGKFFLKADIERFFDHVSRTKITRALKKLRFDNRDAFTYAIESTVEKTPNARDYSLPFGFPQSTLMASIALYYSELGKQIHALHLSGIKISVYVDDIIISSEKADPYLDDISNRLILAAHKSGFFLNASKTYGPSLAIEAFNIILTNNSLSITAERMASFQKQMSTGNPITQAAIQSYVRMVNLAQASQLL